MKILTLCVCEKCGSTIDRPKDGIIIQGNVYVAKHDSREGLVGNNIGTSDEGVTVINEVAFHVLCFMEMIAPEIKFIKNRESTLCA